MIERRSPRPRRVAWWVALSVVAAIGVVWWTSLRWSWSTIDDAGFALGWRTEDDQAGGIAYGVTLVRGMAESDTSWGLFRPSYWVYPSLVYWMPIGLVHLLRLLMFVAAVAGPLIAFRRRGASWPAICFSGLLVASAGSLLTNGLFFLSLQELSGAALIGLGLALPRGWLRVVAWLLAAWFKSPFAWLLIGEAVILWRRGHRLEAIVSGVAGGGTLAVAALYARMGDYTSKYGLDPWRILTNASKLIEVWTALVLVMVLWWLVATRTTLDFTSLSFVLLFGFVGYTAQLLPWAVSGYYLGPIVYLFGLFLASMVTNPPVMPTWQSLVAFSGPILITLYVLYQPIAQGLEMNTILNRVTDCLVEHGGGVVVVAGQFDYVTTEEGVIRMAQNAQLADASWRGNLFLTDPDSPPSEDRLLCNAGPIALYRG